MTREQAARTADESQDGSARAANADGAVIPRRRRSDWTGEPGHLESPDVAAYRAGVEVAAAALAAYDGPTADHSEDVVEVSEAIADRLHVTGEPREHLAAAARLHDIGKVAVPASVLTKPGPLDDDEWELVRRHTLDGERILSAAPEMEDVARIVRHTHERYDGGGYPDGLAGEEIPLAARIVFCADAFHAIRSDRPYRGGRTAREALAEIEAGAGTQFDPMVAAALCDVARAMRADRRRGVATFASRARSRRLAVLLLTLTIGGSALAATGGWRDLPVVPDAGGDGGGTPTACPAPDCSPVSLGRLGTLPAPTAAQARRASPAPADAKARSRSEGGAATPRSAGDPAGGSGGDAARGPVKRNGNGRALGRRGLAPGQTKVREPKKAREPKRARQQTPGRSEAAPGKPQGRVKGNGGTGRSGEAPGKPDGPGKFGRDR